MCLVSVGVVVCVCAGESWVCVGVAFSSVGWLQAAGCGCTKSWGQVLYQRLDGGMLEGMRQHEVLETCEGNDTRSHTTCINAERTTPGHHLVSLHQLGGSTTFVAACLHT